MIRTQRSLARYAGKHWKNELHSHPKKKTLNKLRRKTQPATMKHLYYSYISGGSCVIHTAFRSKAVTINQKVVTLRAENSAQQTEEIYA
jgi:hypothetical protein